MNRDALAADPPPKSLTVALDDIISHDSLLAQLIRTNPGEYLPLLESAAEEVVLGLRNVQADEVAAERPKVQIMLTSEEAIRSLRTLGSHEVSKLVKVRTLFEFKRSYYLESLPLRANNLSSNHVPSVQSFIQTRIMCDHIILCTE